MWVKRFSKSCIDNSEGSLKLRDSCVCFSLNKGYGVAINNMCILMSRLEASLNSSTCKSLLIESGFSTFGGFFSFV